MARRWPAVGTFGHWTFLLLSAMVVLASFALHVRNGEEVVLPISNVALPGTCTFRNFTGLPCPGCGLTRAFISVAHGQVREAWHYNPAGLLFFAIVAFQIPYRIFQIVQVRQGRGHHRFAWFDTATLIGLATILLVQWLYRLAAHL